MKIDNRLFLFTAALSLTEIGLGSLLHGLKIPFSGHFLSLNQAFLLSILSTQLKEKEKFASFEVSTATAALKSLAPAGKKLTPMLAITAQGFLHNLGTIIFGRGLIGICTANIFTSLWAFIQPWLIYYILYAQDLFAMALYFIDKLSPIIVLNIHEIAKFVLLLVFIKMFLALLISIMVFKLDQLWINQYINRLSNITPLRPQTQLSVKKGVIKDLTSPLFIISFILMSSFYYFTGSDFAKIIWNILRPLAVAIIIFTVLRVVPLENLIEKINKIGFKRLSYILQQTINKINGNPDQ